MTDSLKLYKLELPKPYLMYYEQYLAAVVCAKNEQEARDIHPGRDWSSAIATSSWIPRNKIHMLKVSYIGVADTNLSRGVILTDYHAR